MKRRYVTADDGTRYELAPLKETGLAPCNGEAHSNPFIDHCTRCAPRWGQMMTYAKQTPAECAQGYAVPVGGFDTDRDAFEAAHSLGAYRMVHVTETKPGIIASYYVWVQS